MNGKGVFATLIVAGILVIAIILPRAEKRVDQATRRTQAQQRADRIVVDQHRQELRGSLFKEPVGSDVHANPKPDEEQQKEDPVTQAISKNTFDKDFSSFFSGEIGRAHV